jgi:hypothetical protein
VGFFIRWSGVSALVGGVAWALLRPLAASAWHDDLYSLTYEDYNRLLTFTWLLFGIAIFGLIARFNQIFSRVGVIGSCMALIGITLLLCGNIIEFWIILFQSEYVPIRAGGENIWPGAEIGWALHLIGLVSAAIGFCFLGIVLRSTLRPVLITLAILLPFAIFLGNIIAIGLIFGLTWCLLGNILYKPIMGADFDENEGKTL